MRATSGAASSVVDMYNVATGAWSTAQLSVARYYIGAASVGNLALFVGGQTSGRRGGRILFVCCVCGSCLRALQYCGSVCPATASSLIRITAVNAASNVVDLYNVATGAWSTARLIDTATELAAASVGNVALFATGYGDVVYIYCNSSSAASSATAPVIIACVVLADLVLACVFFCTKRLNAADGKGWILAALILGPFVWFIWWYKHRAVGALQLAEPQLLDNSLQHESFADPCDRDAFIQKLQVRVPGGINPESSCTEPLCFALSNRHFTAPQIAEAGRFSGPVRMAAEIQASAAFEEQAYADAIAAAEHRAIVDAEAKAAAEAVVAIAHALQRMQLQVPLLRAHPEPLLINHLLLHVLSNRFC